MSAYWLKLIGSSQNPCPEPYTRTHADFARRPRNIEIGDHMILYATGGRQCVFAIAEVTSDVYEATGNPDENGRWAHRMNIKYLVNMSPADGVPIDDVSTPVRDLRRSVGQHSFIKLSAEEYERAATKLQQKA